MAQGILECINAAKPQDIETTTPTPRNPALTHIRPFTVCLAKSKDDSIEDDEWATEEGKVYTDSLAQEGKVGEAAVLIREGKPTRKLHYHLGTSTQHTVHEAELIGILLGLHLIKTDRRGKRSYAIGVDNQAALSSLKLVKGISGRYIADEILETAVRIRKQRNSPKYSLRFRWTAGHVGIAGNEEVDKEAKAATEGLSSDKKVLPMLLRKPLMQNKAALRQARKGKLKERWKREWDASERAEKFKTLDLISPSNKFIKLISIDRLSRNDASQIFQLRTGHVPLNVYLERIKRAEKASCPACGHPRESVQHFIFDCPSYSHERWAMLKHSNKHEPKLKDILNFAEMVLPLTNYIQATGRFEIEELGGKGERGGEGRGRGARNTQNHRSTTPRHEGPHRQPTQE